MRPWRPKCLAFELADSLQDPAAARKHSLAMAILHVDIE
jgi:hypothetical protein